MIIVMQCVIRYAIAQIEDVDITLSTLGLLFLILATVLIAAGGYVINDIYDVVADKINKAEVRFFDRKEKTEALIWIKD